CSSKPRELYDYDGGFDYW
nr:immunoglobulin heavy chain junction region [Mus musculus]